MGFSVFGTIIVVLTMLPSLVFFIFFPPVNKPSGTQAHEPLPLTILERLGQAACLILLVILRNWFDTRRFDIWLALSIACLLVYYGLWIRYLIKGRNYALLYKPLLFIPVPLAVIPVAVFAFAAVWGQSLWLGIAAVLFGSGHIPISVMNSRLSGNSDTSDSGTNIVK